MGKQTLTQRVRAAETQIIALTGAMVWNTLMSRGLTAMLPAQADASSADHATSDRPRGSRLNGSALVMAEAGGRPADSASV